MKKRTCGCTNVRGVVKLHAGYRSCGRQSRGAANAGKRGPASPSLNSISSLIFSFPSLRDVARKPVKRTGASLNGFRAGCHYKGDWLWAAIPW
jgi:hypothetical protein